MIPRQSLLGVAVPDIWFGANLILANLEDQGVNLSQLFLCQWRSWAHFTAYPGPSCGSTVTLVFIWKSTMPMACFLGAG
jgi:hypothetical protein